MQSWQLGRDIYLFLFELNEIELSKVVLSTSEQKRFNEMGSRTHAEVFAKARYFTKLTIAKYLDVSNLEVILDVGPSGKPYLSEPLAPVNFSISHTGSYVLVALTSRDGIGADIEMIDPVRDLDLVGKRIFTDEQRIELSAISDEALRRNRSFEFWCQYEARFKLAAQPGLESSGILIPGVAYAVAVAQS